MEPNHVNTPSGNPTDVFPRKKKPFDKYASDLRNFAYSRDQAIKRNKIYLGLIAICIVATVFTVCTMSYKTYVVRVDNATGAIETGGELKTTNYTPQEAEVKHFLSQFIMQTRTIPLDPVQFQSNWKTASQFMTDNALQKYTAMVNKEKPAAKLGKKTVQPVIKTIQLYPGSKNTYQIRWYEEEYSLNGGSSGKPKNYVGLFQFALKPSGKEQELLINPLGFKIIDMNYSPERTTGNTEPESTTSSVIEEPDNTPREEVTNEPTT